MMFRKLYKYKITSVFVQFFENKNPKPDPVLKTLSSIKSKYVVLFFKKISK